MVRYQRYFWKEKGCNLSKSKDVICQRYTSQSYETKVVFFPEIKLPYFEKKVTIQYYDIFLRKKIS